MSPDDPCFIAAGGCGHLRKGHAKRGPKKDHPSFRTLAKQNIDRTNSDYYPTTENAYCENPICSCTDFVEEVEPEF